MQYRRLPTDDNNAEDPLRPPDYEPTNNNNSHFNSQEQRQLNNNNDKDNNNNITTFSSPHSFRSTSPVQSQQRVDLEETFDESIDDSTAESQRLLSPWQQEENTIISIPNNPSASSSSSSSSSSSNAATTSQPATLPVPTDGVFSNMSAKPESERDKLDETPPAYDEAVADATPPYWHTAIYAPTSLGDLILIEGLPAGNIMHFAWNLIISASFQFIGFMLTYLFHTTHAGKNGSRAGLGVTFIQFGFYVRSHDDGEGGSSGNNEGDNIDIIAYILMIFGWFIIIRSVADYIRVKRMERIIATQPSQAIEEIV